MERFPATYTSPVLIPVQDGHMKGWTARCWPGGNPGTAQAVCINGNGISASGGHIDPAYLQGTIRRSGLLTD